MKPALLLLILLLCGSARANDALVLISPDRAGPIVDENSYVHGEWILWPAAQGQDGANQLLSLLSGTDWSASGNEFLFGRRDGHFLSLGAKELESRGYFDAREKIVQTPSIAVGTSPVASFLALDGRSPVVKPFSLKEEWPKAATVFATVDSWDRVAAIVSKAQGRVLVIEYPPRQGQRWSRYWLRGSGWSKRLPVWHDWDVPGLIPASQAGNLLVAPSRFQWVENDASNWGGANRWLAFTAYVAPLTFSILGFLAAFFVGSTVYLISQEERARFGATVVKYLFLLPASVLLGGRLTAAFGTPGVLAWLILSFAGLVVVSQLLGALLAKIWPRTHSLLALAAVGLAVTACCPPLWTLYSNVFGIHTLPLSPEATGAFFAYLVATCAFLRGAGQGRWIARAVALLAFGWGLTPNCWWVSGQWPFAVLPLVALLIGDRVFRLWMIPVFALLPLADGRLILHGASWAPDDLFRTASQAAGMNLARYTDFLLSHGFMGSVVIAGAMALFVERLFFHEIRRTLLRDTRDKALFHASFVCAAMGLFQPLMLYPALICFVGGTLVLLTDTAGAL